MKDQSRTRGGSVPRLSPVMPQPELHRLEEDAPRCARVVAMALSLHDQTFAWSLLPAVIPLPSGLVRRGPTVPAPRERTASTRAHVPITGTEGFQGVGQGRRGGGVAINSAPAAQSRDWCIPKGTSESRTGCSGAASGLVASE